ARADYRAVAFHPSGWPGAPGAPTATVCTHTRGGSHPWTTPPDRSGGPPSTSGRIPHHTSHRHGRERQEDAIRIREVPRRAAACHPHSARPVTTRSGREVPRTLESRRGRLLRARRPSGHRPEVGRAGRLLRRTDAGT